MDDSPGEIISITAKLKPLHFVDRWIREFSFANHAQTHKRISRILAHNRFRSIGSWAALTWSWNSRWTFACVTDEVFAHDAPAPPAQVTAAAQPQAAASRSLLPKASQSGLRPPGFSSSRATAGRLAAFSFVRSSSVSSVTSAHSADSTHSDPVRTTNRESTPNKSCWYNITAIYNFMQVFLLSLCCAGICLLIPLGL